ncbi:hypothetical protein BDV95DRAFT_586494 [Massariosphaeria phaeospora]|uniref:Uncharacterized protein n=1 Tax=Massariosphaeria phaeospora TaxID=100035 RepID=A0A7C8MBV0_9PLEO|nr:hypothetical protein BDV95DRAFT_586494 [Massariosphaeria phaeospora]
MCVYDLIHVSYISCHVFSYDIISCRRNFPYISNARKHVSSHPISSHHCLPLPLALPAMFQTPLTLNPIIALPIRLLARHTNSHALPAFQLRAYVLGARDVFGACRHLQHRLALGCFGGGETCFAVLDGTDAVARALGLGLDVCALRDCGGPGRRSGHVLRGVVEQWIRLLESAGFFGAVEQYIRFVEYAGLLVAVERFVFFQECVAQCQAQCGLPLNWAGLLEDGGMAISVSVSGPVADAGAAGLLAHFLHGGGHDELVRESWSEEDGIFIGEVGWRHLC